MELGCCNSARRAEQPAKQAISRPQAVTHGAEFQGCHFYKSGLPLCAESARRAEQACEAGLKSPTVRQLRFRVATSTIQGRHFVHNQPEGLSGPAKRASNRLQSPFCAKSAQRQIGRRRTSEVPSNSGKPEFPRASPGSLLVVS